MQTTNGQQYSNDSTPAAQRNRGANLLVVTVFVLPNIARAVFQPATHAFTRTNRLRRLGGGADGHLENLRS